MQLSRMQSQTGARFRLQDRNNFYEKWGTRFPITRERWLNCVRSSCCAKKFECGRYSEILGLCVLSNFMLYAKKFKNYFLGHHRSSKNRSFYKKGHDHEFYFFENYLILISRRTYLHRYTKQKFLLKKKFLWFKSRCLRRK